MPESTNPRQLARDLIAQLLEDREQAKTLAGGRDFTIDQKIQLAQAAALICVFERLSILQDCVVTLTEAIEAKKQ